MNSADVAKENRDRWRAQKLRAAAKKGAEQKRWRADGRLAT